MRLMGLKEAFQKHKEAKVAERKARELVAHQLQQVANRRHPDIPVTRGQTPIVEDYGSTARVTIVGPDDRAPAKSYLVRGYGDRRVISEGDVPPLPVTRR